MQELSLPIEACRSCHFEMCVARLMHGQNLVRKHATPQRANGAGAAQRGGHFLAPVLGAAI